MTERQMKKLAARIDKIPRVAMIDSETALKAMNFVTKIADKQNIAWALVGRVAMSYYGSPRLPLVDRRLIKRTAPKRVAAPPRPASPPA